MGNCWLLNYIVPCLCVQFLIGSCMASGQTIGRLKPGFQGSQRNYIHNNGLFLLSNNSNFGFGFNTTTQDKFLYLLVVKHISSQTVVWSSNRGTPVHDSDDFVFDDTGNALLKSGALTVWSTNTGEKGVSALELQNSGNLVFLGTGNSIIWQSFDHPTDTLLSNQEFKPGTKLVSNPNSKNLSYSLEIKSGDIILSAGFQTPQPYWAMGKDNRRTINKDGGDVTSATLTMNTWRFYDQSKALLWQFIFSDSVDSNTIWAAVLQDDGFVYFNLLQGGLGSVTKIPENECSSPSACDPYFVCWNRQFHGVLQKPCRWPLTLPSSFKPENTSYCKIPTGPVDLINLGDNLSYSAIAFVPPVSTADLNTCKSYCLTNCSCLAMFFESSSGNCYLFDQIGNFQDTDGSGSGFITYVKVSARVVKGGEGSAKKRFPIVIIIVLLTIIIILGLIYGGIRYYQKNTKKVSETPEDENNFLEGLSGMPIRYSYKYLQTASNNFSIKLGQGGFGSVYLATIRDGSRVAIKQLEGVGQGKKEFRAEASSIGSIHHVHLVRLRGFCAEGTHRLLVYKYMENGSLERWLFKKNREDIILDWGTRYNIAVGTAKGLAYLHQDCDVKIVHCDIKPENILLDDNFMAKVSDFGLAKLMNREQSRVLTAIRGTRGYLAPEWITNNPISEKSDVYSYGMLLLEIIGGRRNYDQSFGSERFNFPNFAFKMMEEGKFYDILDSRMEMDEEDERVYIAIKVALWCIQNDMHLRPPMAKVVRMLEGINPVPWPPPPTSSQVESNLYSNVVISDTNISAVQLSGPR